jgi:NAD(P) transhydrogenase subunit beta
MLLHMTAIFLVEMGYLLGTVGFVWGLRLLSSPDTARKGNIIAGIGMALAILAACLSPMEGANNNYGWLLAALAVGTLVGNMSAQRVAMTAMPQLVSIFNGLGGATAVLLGIIELNLFFDGQRSLDAGQMVIILSALLIGGIAFTGSFLAYGKLEGIVKDNTFTLPMQHIVNMAMLLAALVIGGMLTVQMEEASFSLALVFMVISLLYGVYFVAPIGGADMPVVISLLNSFSGLSAAAAGLIYGSNFMLVGGILVGASGTILTVMMCNAMNRSLLNVLVGGFGGSAASGGGGGAATGDMVVKEVSMNDAAIQLYYSGTVVFVPGYGLAVAQAQKALKEVDDLLEANGVTVRYAIHPVAGRMPGHMNVLLAEADVPYPKLLDLEEANDLLKDTDVVVIVGANDVVNPAAEDDPSSPIYGMPVLKVWNAKHTIVVKRGMSAGYAGIENPLFFHPKNKMLFGDAKKVLTSLVSELKGL